MSNYCYKYDFHARQHCEWFFKVWHIRYIWIVQVNKTSAGSYSLLSLCPSWIPFLSFKALITQLLPIYTSRQYHRQIYLFWLTKWEGQPRLWMAIAFGSMLTLFIVTIALLGYASLRVKKFWSFLAWAMIFPFFISVIAVGSLWNVILISRNWPKNIKLISHSSTKATFCSLILQPSANGIDMVPISSIRMTYLAAVMKSMLLALLLVNRLGLLQRWQDTQESKNQLLLDLIFWNCWSCWYLIIKAVLTRLRANSSWSDSLWFALSFTLW